MVVGVDNRVLIKAQTMKSMTEIIENAVDIRVYDIEDIDPVTNYVDIVNHKVDLMVLLPGKFQEFCKENGVPTLIIPEH